MRVKLQLVMCSDEDHEETVTDVMTLNKNNQRIEHLGVTLAEAKQLLSTLQHHLLQHQIGVPGVISRKFSVGEIATELPLVARYNYI